MAFARPGEVAYSGVGSFLRFLSWVIHRTALVKPAGKTMWKLAAFYGVPASPAAEPTVASLRASDGAAAATPLQPVGGRQACPSLLRASLLR